jgi:predicted membrane protein
LEFLRFLYFFLINFIEFFENLSIFWKIMGPCSIILKKKEKRKKKLRKEEKKEIKKNNNNLKKFQKIKIQNQNE